MFCFNSVKWILDDLYQQIDLASEFEKDQQIRQALEYLRNCYKARLNRYDINIDYGDMFNRFAYMYCYVSAHADVIYQIIDESVALKNLFGSDLIRVSCLGGGPGSDLLGIFKYLYLQDSPTKIRCNIYDKETNWHSPLQSMTSILGTPYLASWSLRPLDITKRMDWDKYLKPLGPDLFTMSYLLSELSSTQHDSSTFLKEMFEYAKSGSFFLFVDNCSGNAHVWLDETIEDYNEWSFDNSLKLIKSSDNMRLFQMDYSEEKTVMEPYYSKFGDPKLKSPAYYRIYRKE